MKHRRFIWSIVIATLVGGVGFFGLSFWRGDYDLRIARTALKARDAEQAQSAAERAVQHNPQNGEAFLLLARAFRRQGKLQEVRQNLSRARQFGVPEATIRREEWLAMAQVGQMKEAGPHLAELLVNPGDDGPEICEAYANGYFLLYRFAEASRILDAWQQDFPNDPQPHVFRGTQAIITMGWSEAVTHFRKALALAPKRTDIRLRLANALLTQHQFDEAARHFEDLARLKPNDPEVLVGWGRVLMEQGQFDKARQSFDAVLKLSAHQDESTAYAAYAALVVRGQMEANDNHIEEAIRYLQSAVDLQGYNIQARYALANALQRAGRNDEAKSHFHFVSKAQEAQQRLQQLMEQVTAQADDVDARFEIAELLREYGSSADRGAWLRSIVELDPKHQKAQSELADYFASIGLHESATKHRTIAEALGARVVKP